MTQQTINIGTVANDGTGDPARTAFGKVNDNFDELYAVGYVAPAATGVAATDTDALQAWITACGVNATLHLRSGNTYVIDKGLTLLAGQKLIGHGAVLKRCTQVSTTTTTDTTSGVNTPITVASTVGFRVGQSIVIYDNTTGVTAYDASERVITDITGDVITCSTSWGLTATNTLQVHLAFDVLTLTAGNEVRGVEFDGNKANWTFGRWEHCNEIEILGSRCIVRECYFHDCPGEGIQEGASASTSIAAGTNAISAGGTTATVADASVFAVGDYVTLYQSPAGEPLYHRITDITGSVITVPAPGWWFAASSGTVTAYKGNVGCRYESNTFDRINGNGVHMSGSYGTQIVNNHFLNTNLDANMGHIGGGVAWSICAIGVKVLGNHFDNNRCACGYIKGIYVSDIEIAGNTIENSVTNALEILYSGTDGYGPREINVNNNIFRNCADVFVGITGSTTDETKYLQNISFTGNQFYKTRLAPQRIRNLAITGNTWDWGAYSATNTTQCINQSLGSVNVNISGNTMNGGYGAVALGGALLNVSVVGNVIRDSYIHGIYNGGSANTAVVISGNSITNGSSASAGSYSGIYTAIGTGVTIQGNIVALTTGSACIRLDGNGGVIQNNTVSNAAYNGSARFEIWITTGKTGYVCEGNKCSNLTYDPSGLSTSPIKTLLFVKRAADLQSTADQALTAWPGKNCTRYMVTDVTAICKTGGASVACAGGIYTAASKGGTALVAAAQSWLNLSAANKIVQATLDAVNATDSQSAATLYFALTTGSTAAATADIFVYGTVLD